MADNRHSDAMVKLCRICGQRCLKHPCAKHHVGINKIYHAERLHETFGVNVTEDVEGQHPLYLCKCCVAELSIKRPSSREVENYTKLFSDMVDNVRELTENEDIWDLAESVRAKFAALLDKFGKCHHLYSTASTLDDNGISTLRHLIMDLVDFYQSKFVRESFTPKFHMLMNHVIDFCIKTGVSLGVMTEQGGEQLHSLFNSLKKRLVGVKKTEDEPPELALLRACVEEHLIQVYPENRKTASREE